MKLLKVKNNNNGNALHNNTKQNPARRIYLRKGTDPEASIIPLR